MTRLSLALALFAGITAVPSAALAMEPYLPKSPKSFGKLDADANGKVTAAEIAPRAEKRFTRMDADRNGAVSAAEIDAALQAAMERRRNRMMSALDADGNGLISRAELDSFVEKMVAAADTDHDGGVTFDEVRNFQVAKSRKTATGETPN
jgi:Ca2+-binding EF-hand superfamily protein